MALPLIIGGVWLLKATANTVGSWYLGEYVLNDLLRSDEVPPSVQLTDEPPSLGEKIVRFIPADVLQNQLAVWTAFDGDVGDILYNEWVGFFGPETETSALGTAMHDLMTGAQLNADIMRLALRAQDEGVGTLSAAKTVMEIDALIESLQGPTGF